MEEVVEYKQNTAEPAIEVETLHLKGDTSFNDLLSFDGGNSTGPHAWQKW